MPTAPHGLVRLGDGTLAYLSRRFDRPTETDRWHQEDFCQLAERPTADKYKRSLEAVRFLELNLFCWLSGNADMHLKTFSLLLDPGADWSQAPASDLVSTALVLPEDREETALTVNGKKAKLRVGLGPPPHHGCRLPVFDADTQGVDIGFIMVA